MNNLGCIRELQVMRLIPDEIYEFESIFFFQCLCSKIHLYASFCQDERFIADMVFKFSYQSLEVTTKMLVYLSKKVREQLNNKRLHLTLRFFFPSSLTRHVGT